MLGIVYRLDVIDNKPNLKHWTLQFGDIDAPITKELAYRCFRTACKRFKISGRTFTFYLRGNYYIIYKTKDDYIIFELGAADGKPETMVEQDGHAGG